MSKDNKKDDRNLDDLLNDIEGHMDKADKVDPKQGKPAPQKPIAPVKKGMRKPDQRGAPVPRQNISKPQTGNPAPSNQASKQKKEDLEKAAETEKKFAEMQKSLNRQRTRITKSSLNGTRKYLTIAIIFAAIIVMLFIALSFRTPPLPEDLVEELVIDPNVPMDSVTGDIFKEQRESFKTASSKLSSGDYSGLDDLKELVNKSPKSPQAPKSLLVLATTYRYNLGNNDEAVKAYAKFLELYPNHRNAISTRKHLISLLISTGNYPQAREHAETLLKNAITEHDRAFAKHSLKQIGN